MNTTTHLPLVPNTVKLFFIVDFLLVTAFVIDQMTGGIGWQVSVWLHLEKEQNLPTWYSTIQLFVVASLFAIYAVGVKHTMARDAWLVVGLSGLFYLLSIDEIAQIHEWFGRQLDVVLPGGDRDNTRFHYTGIWMFVVGVPFFIGLMLGFLRLRATFSISPEAHKKLVIGVIFFIGGAAGIETFANFTELDTPLHTLQVALEEGCEMIGVTWILWGAYDLVRSVGFRIQFNEPRPLNHA